MAGLDGLTPVSGASAGAAGASALAPSASRRLIQACRHGGGAGRRAPYGKRGQAECISPFPKPFLCHVC